MEKSRSGMEKIQIRDKHPGSATEHVRILNLINQEYFIILLCYDQGNRHLKSQQKQRVLGITCDFDGSSEWERSFEEVDLSLHCHHVFRLDCHLLLVTTGQDEFTVNLVLTSSNAAHWRAFATLPPLILALPGTS
jgi:hypothetical protein